MTEPTDDEIATLYAEQTGFALDDSPAALLDFARAVLAKWGTPPAVAGEPVAIYHGRCTIDCGAHGHLDMELLKMIPAGARLYTAPQPTQAQAGAVPLTPEQVAEIADAAHREYERLVASGQCAPRWSAVFAHLLEQHHGIGIKGGQHGAE